MLTKQKLVKLLFASLFYLLTPKGLFGDPVIVVEPQPQPVYGAYPVYNNGVVVPGGGAYYYGDHGHVNTWQGGYGGYDHGGYSEGGGYHEAGGGYHEGGGGYHEGGGSYHGGGGHAEARGGGGGHRR